MREIRSKDVLKELSRKGVKKIGKEKISELERKIETDQNFVLDYDEIMQVHQNLLRKEKDQFDMDKKKKFTEVNYWLRAQREEEKIVIEKYCEENGEAEMRNI